MTNKAQLSHLLLDVDFFDKPKIIDFRLTHGWIGISWLIRCYCLMSRATNGIVKRRIVEHLAEEMGVPRYEVVTVTCFESELMTLEGDMVSNSRVLKDQTKLYERREKDREKVKKHRESKLVTVTGQLHNGSVTSNDTVFPVTDTVTEYIDINNNKIENKDPTVLEEEDEIDKLVKLALDVPNDQPWTRSNAYMLSGRRPMKKYPNIFLTPSEMRTVFLKYEPYTPEFRIMCFTQCEEKLRQKVENGERLMSLPAFTWLTTFIYQSALESLTKETRLKNQQSYAKVHP